MTAMAELSDEIILDRLMDAIEAMRNGDDARAKEINHTIPLSPSCAKLIKGYMGRDNLLRLGFDMSLVEAELGKGWLDES